MTVKDFINAMANDIKQISVYKISADAQARPDFIKDKFYDIIEDVSFLDKYSDKDFKWSFASENFQWNIPDNVMKLEIINFYIINVKEHAYEIDLFCV